MLMAGETVEIDLNPVRDLAASQIETYRRNQKS